MALINPGIAGELAGSIGGTTYARNKAGAYARAWAKPINPNTSAQSLVRGNFAYSSGAWATLTLAQKTAWNTYAASITRLNRFGLPYTPSGRQIYMELGANAMTLGSTPLTNPPIETSVPGISITSAQFDTVAGPPVHLDTLTVTGASASNATTPMLLIYATALMPSSRTNFKKFSRLIGIDALSTFTGDITPKWVAAYGIPTIDVTMQYIGTAFRIIDSDTFLGSSKLFFAAEGT